MNKRIASITRRAILKNLALGTATTLSGSLAAFADTPVKGPIVWLDMDQQELDKAYSQFMYAPNIQQVIARYRTNSALVRKRLGEPLRIAYGSKPVESLDVYPTTHPDAPVHIFIHGGAWQQGSAESYGYPAELFNNVCHGARGEGNSNFGAPALVGQSDWYLVRQLEKYRSGLRGAAAGDVSGAQMRAAAGILMDATDIQNVVTYVNSLASH